MTGDQGGLVAAWYRGAWWLWLLRPLELLFRAIAAARRTLYRIGVLEVYRAPRPVVVVGNITVGGTGKTPIVIALVEAMQHQGLRAGVVSRGYGATGSNFPHTVTDQSEAAECGDEPLLIYRRTGCPCVVAPSRPEAVASLLDTFEVDVVISDDGLQHYALDRDMEIAVIDAKRLLGNGFCLPAGPLREPPARLDSVDFILYRGGDDPLSGVNYRPSGLVNMVSGQQRPLAPALEQEQVHAIAGIGQPQQFFQSLEDAGYRLETHAYPDHHLYGPGDFAKLGDKPVIMTEKDAVKCRDFVGRDAWYLKIDAQLPAAVGEAVADLARR